MIAYRAHVLVPGSDEIAFGHDAGDVSAKREDGHSADAVLD